MKLAPRRGARAFAYVLSAVLTLLALSPALLSSISSGPLDVKNDPLAAFRGSEYSNNELMVRLSPGITLAAADGKLQSSSADLNVALQRAGFYASSEVLPGLYKLTARG